jgi:Mrp family chromosome partitioning ATPase
MSRNFELMQEARIREKSPSRHDRQLRTAAPNRKGKRSVAEMRSRQEMAGTREESLQLVQSLFLSGNEDSPRVVVFAGIDSGNAHCSSICARVAETLSEQSVGSICVVDADLNSPTFSQLFDVSPRRGFAAVFSRAASIRDLAKPVRSGNRNLWLFSYSSTEDLSRQALEMSLSELRREFDYVLIGAPPLDKCTDGIALAQLTDGLVLVLETASTRRETVARVTANLQAARIKILGAVLNRATSTTLHSM